MAASNITVSDDLVQQYISITGADKTIALNMLLALNGNLEMAVNMYLEGLCVPEPSESLSPSSNRSSSKSHSKKLKNENITKNVPYERTSFKEYYNSDDNVRSPIPQHQEVLVEDPYHAIPSRTRRPQTCSVFDNFRDFKKEADEQELLINSRGVPPNKKTKRLHELFKPPRDIIFVGNFQTARSFSKSHCRWLLVNVQNSTEFACQIMNRDVWSNKLVREILKENFVLWQVDYESDDGMHYSNFYNVHTYPHLAVIDPRTGERLFVWKNLEMKPTPDDFMEQAMQFLSDHSNLSESFESPSEKEEGIMETSADELEAALVASLNAPTNVVLSDVLEKKQENHNIVKDNQQIKVSKPTDKPALHFNKTDNMDDNAENITIMCRLPNNERKVLSVSFHSTIKHLSEKVAQLGWPIEQYELIKAFPRQNISELDCQLSLKEAGLHKQETVFVQER
ncbi:UBX domain-containing protein 7 isoform X1 [Hydra vulgaris]|uniref:UBX domain-containing protein 7 isoform X1 n=1 Tax=Hydra vulgaris TaxID=6087 RepID=UPI001F5FB820|nr:UBX domain-containing protein 7 [Hydra vulgaris]